MRRFVEGIDRGQATLFPEYLEDWIDADNSVRVIDAFVDKLDLSGLGFDGVAPEAGLPLCGRGGRLCLSCRREAQLSLHERREWISSAPLLDQRLSELRHQTPLYHWQGATDHPQSGHK
jgi:hypothetical protein